MVVFVGVIHRKKASNCICHQIYLLQKYSILYALSCSAVPIMVYEDEVILRGITDND